ncbi:MAG: AAA family ATPase [Pyrinomonadaceae bacterium]
MKKFPAPDDDDETFDEEAEAAERYPFLFEETSRPDEHFRARRFESDKVQEHNALIAAGAEPSPNSRDGGERQNLSAADAVPNYHYLHSLSDELLPKLDFYRYDNLFSARPARGFFSATLHAKGAERLFGEHWHADELAILYADTGAGKSILAAQIAQSIASGVPFGPFALDASPQRVVYFDLELTDQQFERRYSHDDFERPAQFPFHVNFIRCQPHSNFEIPPDLPDYTAFLTNSMVEFIEFSGANVVIIDNITWLNNSSQIGNTAARVMKALLRLKRQQKLSILVLAHTPKRYVHAPLTINDLQGSKMLANFADSIFAMGNSRRGTDFRYLKTVKRRNAAARESYTEVATIRLCKEVCFLGFVFEGNGDERDHIGWMSSPLEPERMILIEKVLELNKKFMTQRQIAAELGVSAATVNRCLKVVKE